MSQRTADFTRPVFGEQALAAFQAELCQRLPLGCTGLKLNDAVVWQLLCYAATRRTTIEQAAQSLDGVPSANHVREQLRELLPVSLPELRQMEQQLNRALQAQLPQGVRAGLQRQAVEVAGDLTDLPYHGEPEAEAAEIRRSQAKSGTTHFHSYASLQIVHHRQRLTLALTFVPQGETMAAVLGRLLEAARALGVRIQRAYFDRPRQSRSGRSHDPGRRRPPAAWRDALWPLDNRAHSACHARNGACVSRRNPGA